MLRRIKVEDLKEGMIFSEPLFFDDGKNRVLGKMHPVSQRELSVLKQWKVPFVMTARQRRSFYRKSGKKRSKENSGKYYLAVA